MVAPDRSEYLHIIEDCFVPLRGRGWMLSPRDVALVDSWRALGIPAYVVVRVLKEGMARFSDNHPPGTSRPSSLAYFALMVGDEAQQRRARLLDRPASGASGASAAPGPPWAEVRDGLLNALADCGQGADSEAVRSVLREAFRAIRQASEGTELWALTLEVDAAIVDGLLTTLDDATRGAIQGEAVAAVAAEPGALGPIARRDQERLALEERVRERFSVVELGEVLGGSGL